MIIERNEFDPNFPFRICGSYGEVDATLYDLKELKKEINKILKDEEKKVKSK